MNNVIKDLYHIKDFTVQITKNTRAAIVNLTQDISVNIEEDFINSGDILTMTVNITNEANKEISIILFGNVIISKHLYYLY